MYGKKEWDIIVFPRKNGSFLNRFPCKSDLRINVRLQHFSSHENMSLSPSPPSVTQKKVKGYRCKPDMRLYKWRLDSYMTLRLLSHYKEYYFILETIPCKTRNLPAPPYTAGNPKSEQFRRRNSWRTWCQLDWNILLFY